MSRSSVTIKTTNPKPRPCKSTQERGTRLEFFLADLQCVPEDAPKFFCGKFGCTSRRGDFSGFGKCGGATLLLVGRTRCQLAHYGEETGGGLFVNHSVEGYGCRQMWGLRTETHRDQVVPS